MDDDGSAVSLNENEADWTNVVMQAETPERLIGQNPSRNESIKSEIIATIQHSPSFR